MKQSPWAWFGAGLVAIALIVGISHKPSPAPVAPPATTQQATTTTTVAPSGVAPWLTPVSAVPVSPQSADLVRRLFVPGQPTLTWFGLGGGQDYSVPVYDVRTATRTIRVYHKETFPGGFGLANGATVPWSDAWRPASSNDANMVITDPSTGVTSDLFSVSWPGVSTAAANSLGCVSLNNWLAGFDVNRDACAAGYLTITDPSGRPADLRTYSGNAPGSSGGGLQGLPLTVTPAEVSSGRITHALKFYVPNSMYGVECTPAQRSDPSQFGVTCSGAVAPAGKFEGAGYATSPGGGAWSRPITDNVPEGTRYSLTASDAQIEEWLTSRGYTGVQRTTARTMAIGLREFGAIVSDTDGYGIGIPAVSDPAAWSALGVVGNGWDLLGGLLTPATVQALAPATNHCADGTTSQWYCWAASSSY